MATESTPSRGRGDDECAPAIASAPRLATCVHLRSLLSCRRPAQLGQLPLHVAAANKAPVEVVRVLLGEGAGSGGEGGGGEGTGEGMAAAKEKDKLRAAAKQKDKVRAAYSLRAFAPWLAACVHVHRHSLAVALRRMGSCRSTLPWPTRRRRRWSWRCWMHTKARQRTGMRYTCQGLKVTLCAMACRVCARVLKLARHHLAQDRRLLLHRAVAKKTASDKVVLALLKAHQDAADEKDAVRVPHRQSPPGRTAAHGYAALPMARRAALCTGWAVAAAPGRGPQGVRGGGGGAASGSFAHS